MNAKNRMSVMAMKVSFDLSHRQAPVNRLSPALLPVFLPVTFMHFSGYATG